MHSSKTITRSLLLCAVSALYRAADCHAQTQHQSAHRHVALASVEYRDAETGVSFRYPAAWTEEDAETYGDNPLIDPQPGASNGPAIKAKFARGWWWPVPSQSGGDPFVEDATFTFAVLPENTEAACLARFDSWSADDAGHTTRTLNGVRYAVVTVADAGLGHSWSHDIYTTLHAGRCLGFSVGSETDHPDEVPRESHAQLMVPRDAFEILESVRLQ